MQKFHTYTDRVAAVSANQCPIRRNWFTPWADIDVSYTLRVRLSD